MKVLRIRVYTSGLEKIPKNQKLMFVGNHRSNFDPIIEWLVLKPWDIAFISKGENFKIPFFGRIIRKCCFMPIDRENPRKALRTINKASDVYLDIVQVIPASDVENGTTHTIGAEIRNMLLDSIKDK